MKLLLLFISITISLKSFSQIPKGANLIKIKSIGFIEICNKLLDAGFEIEKKDNELQTATTKLKEYVKSYNAAFGLNIRVKDSITYISGFVTAPYTKPENMAYLFDKEKIESALNKKGELKINTVFGYAFNEMNKFAMSLSNYVQYEIVK